MDTIELIHLADLHMGFPGPNNLTIGLDDKHFDAHAGRYLREVDIEEAIKNITRAIVERQPRVDIVVIAGDMFNKPTPYPRAISLATKMINHLRKHQIEVVIIDGNHEVSSVLHPGSPTTFLRELTAHVINGNDYQIIRDDHWENTKLRAKKLAIHALPYRALIDNNTVGVSPLNGYINVLLTHGRVHGMDELNSLHRTSIGIPKELLRRGWDYIALGDWHIHKYQPVADVPAYYAGSIEALNYGEARLHPLSESDQNAVRGALIVELEIAKKVVVSTLSNPSLRPVIRLRPIDANDMSITTLMQEIAKRFNPPLPKEALATLEIKDIPLPTWEQINHKEINLLRSTIRRCDIRWNTKIPDVDKNGEALSEATIEIQWESFLEEYLSKGEDKEWYLQQGISLIETARQQLRANQANMGEEGE